MERRKLLTWAFIFLISISLYSITIFSLKRPSANSSLECVPSEEILIDAGLVKDVEDGADEPCVPRLAYLISGSKGDGMQIRRTLQSVYHPRNYYVLHLDLKALPSERANLNAYVHNDTLFERVGNVVVIEDANLVTYRGPTMVAETLHGAAILLREFKDWDWFINLSASDYPLVSQDDILQAFRRLPRDLNFIEHTSHLGWKFGGRAKPIIVDPGLYMDASHGNIMETKYHRDLPTKFKLFTGSAWTVLSRPFVEYTVMGWDNLPRLLLMYYTNFVSSPEGYFHTVICNSPQFRNTVVNHDMHYIAWDNPPKQHPLTLTSKSFGNLVETGAPFARKFREDDPVLTRIDEQLLGRAPGKVTPGGWCIGGGVDSCAVQGNLSILRPGLGAKRMQEFIERLLDDPKYRSKQCATV